jgi:ABC-type transport system substrate-binding protein
MYKQFKRLGIQLVIRATDYNRFQEKMRNGSAQVYMWGWNADYPDPENFLFMLYGPNSKVTAGGENASNYDNPEFNSLFERMKAMDNSPERQLIIDRMVAILHRDAPWAGGFHPKSFALRHAWVHNVKSHQVINNTLKYRRIDPQLREQARRAWNPPITWPLWLLLGGLLLAVIPAYISYRQRELQSARPYGSQL